MMSQGLSETEIPNKGKPDPTGVYILATSGAIKIGQSKNLPNRLSSLRTATPHKIDVVFFGVFGARAAEIERGAKALLRPWRVRGEWFTCSPFIAGIAIEGARDDCPRCREFIDLRAQLMLLEARRELERGIEVDERAEAEFPDLYARLQRPGSQIMQGLGGRKIHLPPKKYTRLIVKGFPEVAWDCPPMPPVMAARVASELQRQERRQRRHL